MWFVTPDAHQPAAAREGTCEYMQDHIRAARKASLCKKPPRALHEGIHYRCVILRPPFRMHENYIDCVWKMFEQCRCPAGHLANTRGNRHRIGTLHNCMETLSEEGTASAHAVLLRDSSGPRWENSAGLRSRSDWRSHVLFLATNNARLLAICSSPVKEHGRPSAKGKSAAPHNKK